MNLEPTFDAKFTGYSPDLNPVFSLHASKALCPNLGVNPRRYQTLAFSNVVLTIGQRDPMSVRRWTSNIRSVRYLFGDAPRFPWQSD